MLFIKVSCRSRSESSKEKLNEHGLTAEFIAPKLWEDSRNIDGGGGVSGHGLAGQYGDMEPAELAASLKEIGVSACRMHLPLDVILDSSNKCYQYAKTFGCDEGVNYMLTAG